MTKDSENFDIPALRARLMTLLGSQTARYPTSVESGFPRILAKLVELWGSEAFEPYIDSLMFVDRPNRHGFPPAVAAELFALSTVHATCWQAPQSKTTAWELSDSADLKGRQTKKKPPHGR